MFFNVMLVSSDCLWPLRKGIHRNNGQGTNKQMKALINLQVYLGAMSSPSEGFRLMGSGIGAGCTTLAFFCVFI